MTSPASQTGAVRGESFTWSSHRSVAWFRKGLAPFHPALKNSAQRRGQIGDDMGSGGYQELGGIAAMRYAFMREIAVSFTPRIGRSIGRARTSRYVAEVDGLCFGLK